MSAVDRNPTPIEPGPGNVNETPNVDKSVELTRKEGFSSVVITNINGKIYYVQIFVDKRLAALPESKCGAVAKEAQKAFGKVLSSAKISGSETTGAKINFDNGAVVLTTRKPGNWRKSAKTSSHLAYSRKNEHYEQTGGTEYNENTLESVNTVLHSFQKAMKKAPLYAYRKDFGDDVAVPQEADIAKAHNELTQKMSDADNNKPLSTAAFTTTMHQIFDDANAQHGAPLSYQALDRLNPNDVRITNAIMVPEGHSGPITSGKHHLALPAETTPMRRLRESSLARKLIGQSRKVAVVLDFDNNRILFHDPKNNPPSAAINALIDQMKETYFGENKPEVQTVGGGHEDNMWENHFHLLAFFDKLSENANAPVEELTNPLDFSGDRTPVLTSLQNHLSDS